VSSRTAKAIQRNPVSKKPKKQKKKEGGGGRERGGRKGKERKTRQAHHSAFQAGLCLKRRKCEQPSEAQRLRGAVSLSLSQWFSFSLQSVSKEDPKALAVALSWDIRKAETVQQACTTELALRLQQVQSLHSLRNLSARRSPLPGEPQRPKRAKRDSS
jgi:hypothetical protein